MAPANLHSSLRQHLDIVAIQANLIDNHTAVLNLDCMFTCNITGFFVSKAR